MDPAMFPVPGTFLRPVARLHPFLYCYEVVQILPDDTQGPDHWTMRRWGLNSHHQPYLDDGPRGNSALHYLTNLERIAPGVWKDTVAAYYEPLYYRQIEVGGQKDLFS
jgi:hypothetical protein